MINRVEGGIIEQVAADVSLEQGLDLLFRITEFLLSE